MEGNNIWLEKAFEIQLKISPECEELSIGHIRRRSSDKALEMAVCIHRHIIENARNCPEFKNLLKEVEIFGEDKARAIGFFYESTWMNGEAIDVDQLRKVADEWMLGNKFDLLLKAFFTGQKPSEIEILEGN